MSTKYVSGDLVSLFVRTWNRHNSSWKRVCKENINLGWCYQFAVLLKQLHGDKVELWRDSGHAWVRINGKFYDSDTPNGTTEISKLSGSPRGVGIESNIDEEAFVPYWRTGGSGPVQYEIINEVIKLYKTLDGIGA